MGDRLAGVGESRPSSCFTGFGDVFRNWYLIVCEYDDMLRVWIQPGNGRKLLARSVFFPEVT